MEPGMLPDRQRDHDLAAHRAFLKVQQAGGDFREEIEQRVGADGHDRRHPQAKDQNREQQNAAPHAGHADEHADDKANQNFGCEQWHNRSGFILPPGLLR